MKMVRSVLLGAALLCAPVGAAALRDNPVGKVLQLISDLQTKVIKEGEDAQKVYAEFSEWCEDRSRSLTFEIKTGKGQVEELKAAIAQDASTIGALGAKVEKLAGDLSVDDADLKAATGIRAKESTDFAAEEKELVEVVGTLQRAIGILERELRKGGASMAQLKNAGTLTQALAVLVQGSMLSTADSSRLASLVQSSSDDEDAPPGAPAAAAYKGQSGSIVEVLSDLLEKAEDQLEGARKKETQDLHAFEMLKQSLTDEIKFGDKEMKASQQNIAAAAEKKAGAEGDLGVTSKDLESDTTALGDMHRECMTKAEDFESETKSRGEELAAIAKAKVNIIEATGGAEEISYGGASFLQTASRSRLSSKADLAGFEVVRAVRDLACTQNSKALMLLSQRLSSVAHSHSADVFGKIKGLISDMIEKLENQAAADATHKAYCDQQLSETNSKKTGKTTEVEKLTTKIDQMTAKSSSLKEEVAALQSALSKVMRSQAEMDKLRQEETTIYKTTQADLEQGLSGVQLALKVLNDYYAKDAAHVSASGSSSGIIGLLEVVESDFSKNLAEVVSTEEAAAAAYEQESKDTSVEKVTKEKDVEHKIKESAYLDKESAALSADRSNVQAELDAILEYFSKIEAACTEVAETYADKKAHREAEIAGLKSALDTLENETSLVQKRVAHRRFRGTGVLTA
mmetsp:Transcript_102869/g.330039  ORF Transcript_102869/g.330039 Transcript_102869/m.330039 type:complete len:686 (+) Transcript_102869:56-2113(+)